MKFLRAGLAVSAMVWAATASAQIVFTPSNTNTAAANAAFPIQNPNGPSGSNYQVSYPYPGQCVASASNGNGAGLFPTLKTCNVAGSSFACDNSGAAQRSAGGWAGCGSLVPFADLPAVVPAASTKFVWEVLNPPDYAPDTAKYAGADYYEIGLHEAWGFQGLATAGLFPNPAVGPAVPNGMQWTGLTCQNAAGCACPADATGTFKTSYCSAGGKIPAGNPLFTPIWGVGQINNSGGPVTQVLTTAGVFAPGTPSSWSANNYVATWPSISIRANKGTPVVVKWTNEFPNNHVLCPHPEAADWPCAIDRTFMGVKVRIDPALANTTLPPDGVNNFGSPQQPDNSWVTHLHGGEVPPSTDGFAEKWFGNLASAAAYAGVANNFVNPAFESPTNILMKRPIGNSDVYTYPMVQEEATIWFHDHSLGKTHHNVIAGPAGFFPVKEPLKHGALSSWTHPAGLPTAATYVPAGSEYTWLDPVTEPRNNLGQPLYDLFLAIQDRAFNEDGSINFSNGLGQTPPAIPLAGTAACVALGVGGVCLAPGTTSVTSGVNPLVHPVWVPEYFGDHALVNGVLWPKKTVAPGWYRLRIVDGSDSRCYTVGFQAVAKGAAAPAPGAAVTPNLPFWVIANDQGYLQAPVKVTPPAAVKAGGTFTMCPGERYEVLVNFSAAPAATIAAVGADFDVYMTNSAAAPFPAGLTPQIAGSPFPDLNLIMRFDVRGVNTLASGAVDPGVRSCTPAVAAKGKVAAVPAQTITWNPTNMAANLTKTATGTYANICMPTNPAFMKDFAFVDLRTAPLPATNNGKKIVRQVYLNERLDGVTLMPLGMQLNGVPFEYKVTETPNLGTQETWQFINLTVDAHPMHPHLVKHQIVSRQNFSVTGYKTTLCGATTCQPGPSPGGEMVVVPDVTTAPAGGKAYLTGTAVLVTPASIEGGFKDVVQVSPAQVTTIVANWDARWAGAGTGTLAAINGVGANAPGTAGCPAGACSGPASAWVYEAVTSGPYVWHCHINSHEDSEMMRTSLVVP
ncbi:MAG: multicopper oxidase domain-containing protein [Deltaproteobacteria bacterium]